MELQKQWNAILSVVSSAKKSNRFFSMATVDADGNPHVTPIGHVFFRDNCTAFYFDGYSKAMPRNFKTNNKVCVMAVNSGFFYWLKSFIFGSFNTPPAVRLFGEVSESRAATAEELAIYRQSIRVARFLKGYELIWQDLDRVREINFDSFRYAQYPSMCESFEVEQT